MATPIDYVQYEKQLKCNLLEIDLKAKQALYVNIETAYNNRIKDGEWVLDTLKKLKIPEETLALLEDQYAKYVEQNPIPTVLDDYVESIRNLSDDTKTAVKKSIKSSVR